MRKQRRNAAAVALAARRMVKMTPEQRTAVAKIAAAARWKKKPDAEPEPVSA